MTMRAGTQPGSGGQARARAANVRTALVLACVALVFFVGIIASEYLGGPEAALGVMGTSVLLFLVLAIGRNLRK